MSLDPKIGKHGRIEQGSGPPKLLSTHHVAERAVMSGEKQPRKRRRQGESVATEQPPPSQLPKGLKRQSRARSQRTNVQRHNTRCTLRPPPLILPPKEVPARGVAPGAGGTEPEGHDLLRSLYVHFLAKSFHDPGDQPTQKSQVMSHMHILPLHLAQVGWGSVSNEDRKAPYLIRIKLENTQVDSRRDTNPPST